MTTMVDTTRPSDVCQCGHLRARHFADQDQLCVYCDICTGFRFYRAGEPK